MSDDGGGSILIPFEPAHLALIGDAPAWLAEPRHWRCLTPGGALTLVGGDGVLGCGGLVAVGGDRAEAWVVLSNTLRRRPVVLHRAVARALAVAPFACVGATVRRGFAAGQRWVERLGFVAVGATAGDYVRYERWRS